jgi:RNA polymerase sigma-70 factor, ECF subfamily
MVASNSFIRSVSPSSVENDRGTRATDAREAALHDAALVRRFVDDGDQGAFAEIVTRYRGKMFSVAFALLKNHADAEEIAQDTFVRAHRSLGNFRGDSALSTWLHRIALNLSRNRYWFFFRRHRHATNSLDCAFRDDNPATLASLIICPAPSPVQEATINEFTVLVAECMERLGAGQRDILTRRNIHHCTYNEIARSFGISVGTVKSRIARARGNLRVLLAQACPEFAPASMPGEWFEPLRPAGRLEILCA